MTTFELPELDGRVEDALVIGRPEGPVGLAVLVGRRGQSAQAEAIGPLAEPVAKPRLIPADPGGDG